CRGDAIPRRGELTVTAAPSTARSCTGGASDRLRGADPLAASSALDRPEGGSAARRSLNSPRKLLARADAKFKVDIKRLLHGLGNRKPARRGWLPIVKQKPWIG